MRGLDPSQKIYIDCPHLQKGEYGGSISHLRLILLGFCKFQEARFLRILYGNKYLVPGTWYQVPAHKSGATLERNAKVPLKCQFYDVFLRVGITKYCKLQGIFPPRQRERVVEPFKGPLSTP